MKRKNVLKAGLTILALLAMILPLPGCSSEDTSLSITPELYEYSPYMSSTPGIPLVAVFTRELKNNNYVYHWTAEEGIFLKWRGSDSGMGRVEILGRDIKTNVHKIYWTVDPQYYIKAKTFEVHLTIEELDTGKALFEASVEIEQTEPLYFVIEHED